MENNIRCENCGVTFSLKQSLYRHIRNVHKNDCGTKRKRTEESCYECDICEQFFSCTYNLKRYQEKKHATQYHGKKFQNSRIICVVCGEKFSFHKDMREHVKIIHLQKLEERSINFNSNKEFYNWKEKLEKREWVSYTRHAADYKIAE